MLRTCKNTDFSKHSMKYISYSPHKVIPWHPIEVTLNPHGQFFMGAKLFIGTPEMRNEGVLKKILVWAM